MAGDEAQKEFDRRVKSIIDNILRHEEESIEAARRLLEQTRSDVIARMAEGGRTEWDSSWLRQVRNAIERRIEMLTRELEVSLNQGINRAFDLGNQLIDEPARIALGVNPVIGVSREVVQVAAQFSATMIRDLTSSAQTSIDAVLRQIALGGITVQDGILQVGTSLDSSKTFRSIAARSDMIIRTEVLRIQSIATQTRMQKNSDAMRRSGWALGKSWLPPPLSKRSRLTHFAALGQERDVDEPFNIGGEELMYPRDPKGSAENTIGCRCVSIPTTKRIYKLDRDRKFER